MVGGVLVERTGKEGRRVQLRMRERRRLEEFWSQNEKMLKEGRDLLSELLLILWQDHVSPVTSYFCLPMLFKI